MLGLPTAVVGDTGGAGSPGWGGGFPRSVGLAGRSLTAGASTGAWPEPEPEPGCCWAPTLQPAAPKTSNEANTTAMAAAVAERRFAEVHNPRTESARWP